MYNIEAISIKEVERLDRDRFNSNNHWNNKEKPKDYELKISQCNLINYIDQFHPHYTVINIPWKEMRWIEKAYAIGNVKLQFPKAYLDELEALCNLKLKFIHEEIFNNGAKSYFVRANSVSLKNGIHKAGPYNSLQKIIESLVTNKEGHSAINDAEEGKPFKLYLLPWQQIDKDKEFRVFVCNNEITAISQQFLHQANRTLAALDEKERENTVTQWGKLICDYFDSTIRERITHISNYCIDLALIGEENRPYFIEINCFGKEYAAGSSLFHWLIDEEKLYGKRKDSDGIFIRYSAE
jgi:hypothetical protein